MSEEGTDPSLDELAELRREAMEFVGLGMFRLAFDGTILYADRAALRVAGLEERFPDPTGVVGKNIEELIEYTGEVGSLRRAVREQGRVQGLEYPFRTLSGEDRWARHDSFLAKDPITGEGYVHAVVLDITARKRAEQARMTERMQHAQKLESLGVLSGGIAHDFNNLLVAVLGNADLALMDLAPESPARQAVEQIRTAAVRASDLTNQLLAYSGRGRFRVRPLNLNRMVEEMVHLLKVSMPKRALIQFDLAVDLPAVEADAAQLQQIILNLVTNAAEAIGEGDGVVRLRTGALVADPSYLASTYLAEDLPQGRYAFLEVTDSGIGMDAVTLERIFDPFFTTKFTGRGLGLAAVLGIVRSHLGAIKVYSEPGRGTTFKVLLPATEGEESLEADPHASVRSFRGKGLILVVDDEQTVRQVARDLLERFGFEVELAADGQQALEVVERRGGELRLVLLDMTMPRMNGEQTFSALRRLRAELPVVLCSGYSEADATTAFSGKGLAGFLQKPFEITRLVSLLREVLGQQE